MPHDNGQLTAEELEPTPEQREEGRRLVEEGWASVSNKYRTIRRWVTPPRRLLELLRPEVLDTPEGRFLQDNLRFCEPSLRGAERFGFEVEERVLTVREYRAFRLAGGKSG